MSFTNEINRTERQTKVKVKLGLRGKSKRLASILCCSRHEINRDNYKDEIHLVNRSLIRKYLRYGLKSIFLTFNNLDKNLETPGKLL